MGPLSFNALCGASEVRFTFKRRIRPFFATIVERLPTSVIVVPWGCPTLRLEIAHDRIAQVLVALGQDFRQIAAEQRQRFQPRKETA
jgi:hypothetical protein